MKLSQNIKLLNLRIPAWRYLLVVILSSQVFSASITVVSPNGSEQIPARSTYTIEWESMDLASEIRIEYSTDDGSTWTPVVDHNLLDSGSYLWNPVPEEYTQEGRIQIYAVEDPGVNDSSDDPFYIYACLSEIQADLNRDCYVNMADSEVLAELWLLCANPLDPSCEAECSKGYGECDGLLYNGCEIHLFTDINNCGECGNICLFDNAEALCIDGTCVMGNCLPGYSDLNGDPNDGCEAECTWISDTDLPDDDFIDANCDGIDGELDKAVFVDKFSGSNSNSGTSPDHPKQTIQAGINAAVSEGRDYVLISQGTYAETLTLASGVSLYGSYNAGTNWGRSTNYTTALSGGIQAVSGNSVSNVTIAYVNIASANAGGTGNSSYGIVLKNSSDISVHRCMIQSGKGSGGSSGSNGTSGGNGGSGQSGQPGCENDSSGPWCSTCFLPVRGNGGSSPSGYPGGRGGSPGLGAAPGSNGQSATDGGSGGQGGRTEIDPDGGNGAPGQNGANGSNGNGGSFFGAVSTNGYLVSSGAAGSSGQPGRGGGGGGGGAGGVDGSDTCDSYGGAGAGGGGGAAGGTPGTGGQGGGGSFAVWLYQCNSIEISECIIQTANGGSGGNSGTGGQGGTGGSGGSGGIGEDNSGSGGNGGNGGNGGRGGHGGGGAGGPSVGVLAAGTSALSQSDNQFLIGSGGAGGSSLVNSGATGLSSSVHTP